MRENYMVVELPKENDTVGCEWINDPSLFNDYDLAFDCLNKKLAAEGQQIFRKPQFNTPVRAALADRDIELWVIRRNTELAN